MKKLLALVLAAMMTFGILPVAAFALDADDNPPAYGYNETPAESVNVWVTISNDGVPLMGTDGTILSHLDVKVPYFDLGLYGLDNFYRYETEGGQGTYINGNIVKRPTTLHLYIYLLERYYLGVPESECGKGSSGVQDYSLATTVRYMDGKEAYSSMLVDEEDGEAFYYKALYITGTPTSMYMKQFWGHDENLMYYRNHVYPLMSKGWGSTADYVLLSDGDSIDLAMFSNRSFYTSGAFACFGKDTYELAAGESTEINVLKYETKSSVQGGSESFVPFDNVTVSLYDSKWKLVESGYTIDENGKLNFTAPKKAGTYYLLGIDPNAKTYDACIAPASAKIIVGTGENIMYGDVNGDNKVTMTDVGLLIQYCRKMEMKNPLTSEQLKAGDVNGDNKVTMTDVGYMIQYCRKMINKFPVEQ